MKRTAKQKERENKDLQAYLHLVEECISDRSMEEKQAIQFLKSRGYKILKPTTEWKEL